MFCPDLTFRPRMSVLSAEQMEQIHHATLELLERTGVPNTIARGLELLHEPARTSTATESASHPGWSKTPSAKRRRVWSWPTAAASARCFSRATSTGSGRASTASTTWTPSQISAAASPAMTARVTATLADALPNYTWVMTIGMADDVPADVADRVIAKQVFTYTEKPLVFCCKDVNSVRDIYEMALLIAGGESQFRQAPTIVHYSSPSRRCSITIRPSTRSSTAPSMASR